MCRRYDGKPRITLTPHALMISICRRVGVLAPLPVITGTAPVYRHSASRGAMPPLPSPSEYVTSTRSPGRTPCSAKRRPPRIAIVSRSCGAYSIGRGRPVVPPLVCSTSGRPSPGAMPMKSPNGGWRSRLSRTWLTSYGGSFARSSRPRMSPGSMPALPQ